MAEYGNKPYCFFFRALYELLIHLVKLQIYFFLAFILLYVLCISMKPVTEIEITLFAASTHYRISLKFLRFLSLLVSAPCCA